MHSFIPQVLFGVSHCLPHACSGSQLHDMGLSRNCPELAFVSSRAPCPAAGCLEQCVWEGTWVYSLSSQWGAASVFYCGCCYHELKWLNTTWMILSLFLSPDGCCWAKVKAPAGCPPLWRPQGGGGGGQTQSLPFPAAGSLLQPVLWPLPLPSRPLHGFLLTLLLSSVHVSLQLSN